jgi:mxaD protein
MKWLKILALAAYSSAAAAHGPTPQKVIESIAIDAPIEKVWTVVKDFGAFAQWNPALSNSEGDSRPGAKRILTFANGEQLTEELDSIDDTAHELSYRLGKENVKALPASSYSAALKLTADGTGTKLEWKSRLYRGDTGNFPSDDMTDEAATKAMQSFFATGLKQLKKKVESE